MPLNKTAMVSHVSDQSTGMLELLSHKKIGIGTKLEVKKKFSYDNSLEIKIRQQTAINISEQLAKNIFVKYGS
jgi:DtxR family Mn-dependent transcriptional regulator